MEKPRILTKPIIPSSEGRIAGDLPEDQDIPLNGMVQQARILNGKYNCHSQVKALLLSGKIKYLLQELKEISVMFIALIKKQVRFYGQGMPQECSG